jgi:hypothetical protein
VRVLRPNNWVCRSKADAFVPVFRVLFDCICAEQQRLDIRAFDQAAFGEDRVLENPFSGLP